MRESDEARVKRRLLEFAQRFLERGEEPPKTEIAALQQDLARVRRRGLGGRPAPEAPTTAGAEPPGATAPSAEPLALADAPEPLGIDLNRVPRDASTKLDAPPYAAQRSVVEPINISQTEMRTLAPRITTQDTAVLQKVSVENVREKQIFPPVTASINSSHVTSGESVSEVRMLSESIDAVFKSGPKHWFWSPPGLFHFIQAVSGSETEARELSLGLMVLRSGAELPRPDKFTFSEDCPQIVPGAEQLAAAIALPVDSPAVTENLIDLAPFYPGGAGRPLLVLRLREKTGEMSVEGGWIPEPKDASIRDTHELYKALTGDYPPGVATIVWLKPARSIRVYHGARLCLQSLQLRKTQRRCYRSPDDLLQLLSSQMKSRGLVPQEPVHGGVERLCERLLAIAVELSEERLGGAVYIMSRELFDSAVQRTKECPIRINSWQRVPGARGRDIEFNRVSFATLLQVVREDGATVVSPEGHVLGTRVYFDGVGGRKNTARYICCRKDADTGPPPCALALVISQDGDVLVSDFDRLTPWGRFHSATGSRPTSPEFAENSADASPQRTRG